MKKIASNQFQNCLKNSKNSLVFSLKNLSAFDFNSSSTKKFMAVTETFNKSFRNSKIFNSFNKFNFGAKLPRHKKLTLPNLSPSMEKGNIVEWKKKEGQEFQAGESIAGIETDKAVVDFEVNESGFIAKIIKPAGSKDIPLGTLIAITVENKEDIESFKDYKGDEAAPSTPTETPKPEKTKTEKTKPENPEINKASSNEIKQSQPSGSKVFASPLAKKNANELGISLSNVEGTGPNNRIINADVQEFNSKKSSAQDSKVSSQKLSSENDYTDIPVSQIRKVIASRLVLSKTTIPHFYLQAECKVDKLVDLRERLNKVSKVKISFNDIILKACAVACVKVPEANSTWNESTIRMNKNVDISVAVQTDNGLITPIVFNAHTKRLGEIATDVKELAGRAKEGKLKPQEFVGGTFTVSNLGMMGISSFSAIINPGQSCILAVGRVEKKVVYDEHSKNKDAPYKIANTINATLSCDHRTVDGAVGAKWVSEFRQLMEEPELLLL